MSSFIERLAGRVVSLEKKVNRALTSPQLGSSSIENGGSIEEYDEDGQLVSIIGTQPDGTHGAVVVSGPVPPRPAAPQASGGPGLLNYAWGGVFANAATGEPEETIPAPMDFARVEVHASKTSGFSAVTANTLIGTIESPRGSSNSVVAESGTWYVVLVTRALSGKASMQSLETSAVVQAAPDVEGLLEEFNQEADRLQQELNANAGELAAAQGRLDTLTTRTGTVESSLATVQSQVNTKNKVVNSTGNASGTTGYVAGDTWQKWTTLADGGKLVAAWRFTVNNTWLPVILDPTYLPLVDIGQGTFGTLSGSRLDANSVTAGEVNAQSVGAAVGAFVEADIGKLRVIGDSNLNTVTAERIAANIGTYLKLYASQLIIGEPGNMLPDPGFQDPEGWQVSASGYAILPTGGRNSNAALEIAASANQMGRYYGAADRKRQFRVTGGATYQAKVWYKSDAAITAANRVSIYGKWTNPSTAVTGNFATPGNAQNTGPVAANTWTELVYEFTVPAEATHAFIGLYVRATHNSRVLFSEPSVREKITPSLIVDGFFQGLRVIGASIETNAAVSRGIKLNDAGLFAFDSEGVQTFKLDSTTGAVSARGNFSSASDGVTVNLGTKTSAGVSRPMLYFNTPSTHGAEPHIFVEGYDRTSSGGFTQGTMVLSGSEVTPNSSGRNQLRLAAAGEWSSLSSTWGPHDSTGFHWDGKSGEAWTMGMLPAVHRARQQMRIGYGNRATIPKQGYLEWTVTQISPPPVGVVRPWIQLEHRNNLGAALSPAINSVTRTGFKMRVYNPQSTDEILEYWFYMCYWTPTLGA